MFKKRTVESILKSRLKQSRADLVEAQLSLIHTECSIVYLQRKIEQMEIQLSEHREKPVSGKPKSTVVWSSVVIAVVSALAVATVLADVFIWRA